jgi:hypothetical protein
MSRSHKNKPKSEEWKRKIGVGNTGKVRSEESRKNISKNHADMSGENNPMYGRRGVLSPQFGKKASETSRKKMSENNPMKNPAVAKKNADAKRGSKHPNWKGGITPLKKQIRDLLQYKAWTLSVYERDNFTCKICQQHGNQLEAHHKKPFAQILIDNNITSIKQALECNELWDVDNGVTLCLKCHKKEHKKSEEK